MANKDLFKQAIADAKSIREAAIANAKLALEESLTPQLKELLAQRLAEMEEEDAPAAVVAEEATEEVAEESLEEAIGPDGLQAVAEAEEEGEEGAEEEEMDGEEAGEEAEGDSEESEDEATEEEVGEMSVDDLKDLIRDVLMQVMGDEEAAQEDELEAGAEEMGAEDMTAVDDTEINIDELMAELALINNPEGATAHGNVAEAEKEADPLAEAAVNEIIAGLKGEAKEYLTKMAEARSCTMQELMKEAARLGSVSEMKSVAEMFNSMSKLGEAAFMEAASKLIPAKAAPAMEEGVDEMVSPEMIALATALGIPAVALGTAAAQSAIDKAAAGGNKLAKGVSALLKNLGKAGQAGLSGSDGTKESAGEELNEALSTIETLRNELNETNLLNAKLLYVNKVFKANNLTESQKANVIAAFDKAETVKEVKLVYETVSENATATGKKEVVREAKGFASAATGASTKPAVIAEANAAVLRMQKLAGIIK
jgi:uncharacterized protein YbjQ (UPF0145 family)